MTGESGKVTERARRVMAKSLMIPSKTINDDTSYDTIEEWDSVAHVELMFALEEEFEMSFSAKEVEELLSFKEIVDHISRTDSKT